MPNRLVGSLVKEKKKNNEVLGLERASINIFKKLFLYIIYNIYLSYYLVVV